MIQNVMEMNWTDFDKLDKEKTVVFLGFAPIEEHGKHLPLGVDVYETQYWMQEAMKLLDAEFGTYTFLKLPVIPYGHASMKGFPGNIHLSQKLFYDLVLATLRNITEWGVQNIVVISGHADPRHTIAIEQACDKIKEEKNVDAFAPMGAIFSGLVSLEQNDDSKDISEKMKLYSNDFHAGWIETSAMLMIHPELVNPDYKKQPDIELEGRDMVNSHIVEEKIKGYGHIGYPKEASKEAGRYLNQSTSQMISYVTKAYLKRDHFERYSHHRLYHIESLRVKEEVSRNV